MHPLDQFTKQTQNKISSENWDRIDFQFQKQLGIPSGGINNPELCTSPKRTGEDRGGGAVASHETIAKRAVDDRRGFALPGKNWENGGTRPKNHGFSKSIWSFWKGKLIKHQRQNLICLDKMTPLRLKKNMIFGSSHQILGFAEKLDKNHNFGLGQPKESQKLQKHIFLWRESVCELLFLPLAIQHGAGTSYNIWIHSTWLFTDWNSEKVRLPC